MPSAGFRERSRDVQDGWERHIYGDIEYNGQGAIAKVSGTDTKDEEAPVMNVAGTGFKLKKDFNTEVFLVGSSSDTTLKHALLTPPRDKQRRWSEGHGGIQHPTDGSFALDFSDNMAHLTKAKFGVGENGEFEIKNSEGYFRTDKVIVGKQPGVGELIVNKQVKTPKIVNGTEKPPNFEGSKEEPVKQQGQGGQRLLLVVNNSLVVGEEPVVAATSALGSMGTMEGYHLDFGYF